MDKIYSRPRIKIPKMIINKRNHFGNKKMKVKVTITIIIVIAFVTLKTIIEAINPIFDTLCENKAKSIATIISNEEATNVIMEHTYDEMFTIEKDSDNNITMVKSNIISINEIISDVAIKIQESIEKRGRENIEIAMREFYRL